MLPKDYLRYALPAEPWEYVHHDMGFMGSPEVREYDEIAGPLKQMKIGDKTVYDILHDKMLIYSWFHGHMFYVNKLAACDYDATIQAWNRLKSLPDDILEALDIDWPTIDRYFTGVTDGKIQIGSKMPPRKAVTSELLSQCVTDPVDVLTELIGGDTAHAVRIYNRLPNALKTLEGLQDLDASQVDWLKSLCD